MTERHTLPGGFVELRTVEEVTERHRREVRQIVVKLTQLPGMQQTLDLAFANGEPTGNAADDKARLAKVLDENESEIREHLGESFQLVDDLQDASIIARVKAWSFSDENGAKLPILRESLLDLPGGIYDKLKELCAEPITGPDLQVNPDPKAAIPSSTG